MSVHIHTQTKTAKNLKTTTLVKRLNVLIKFSACLSGKSRKFPVNKPYWRCNERPPQTCTHSVPGLLRFLFCCRLRTAKQLANRSSNLLVTSKLTLEGALCDTVLVATYGFFLEIH